MKRLLSLIFIVTLSTIGAAAQSYSKQETERLTKLADQLKGTYQIQIIDSREVAAFPLSMLDSVVSKRQADKVVFLKVKDNVRIKILSTSEIQKKDFQTLERIKYMASSEI